MAQTTITQRPPSGDFVDEVKVNGVKVVGVQQAAISDPSGGLTADTQARTALVAALNALRTHGLIDI